MSQAQSGSRQRVLVAGVGNLFLSDDGFGPEVARTLLADGGLPETAHVVDYGIRGMHLAYDLLDGYAGLVILDAVPGDGAPGEIHVLEVGPDDLGSGELDAHGMNPVAVLANLERLGGTLPPTYVVGCRPATVEDGIGLSPAVEAAVPVAAETVRRLLGNHLSGEHVTDDSAANAPTTHRAADSQSMSEAPCRARRRYEVAGVVQGVGFRPFVYVTASELALTGSVANDVAGVVIEVEGEPASVEEFGRRLERDAPPLAIVESIRATEIAPLGGTGFTIEESTGDGDQRTLASPDVSLCADCLREMSDPSNRRYRHPFITCTNCGPRFTIITDLPYDRATTTMAGFDMCPACRSEYVDPADRRFHAQPIACPDCGPRLRFEAKDSSTPLLGEDALAAARVRLARGEIVAVKGLGGYHLACDAGNEAAVAELRRRKQRGDKPFAVMVADLEAAHRIVDLGPEEEQLLGGVRRPIMLTRARAGEESDSARPSLVAPSVAPGNPDLGVLLPYTPLHVLLLGLADDVPGPPVLVMTSGNLSGEPIVTDDAEARTRLEPLVDAWLTHGRPIHVPCDDSVARVVAGAELPIRRSRGYAPLPIALPFDVDPTLAVGADLKNTCALASGRYAWVSQHIGDMDDLATLDAFSATEQHLERLTGVEPGLLVSDQHPGYRSTGWARTHAQGRPVRTVQHHHAHVASVMGEHGLGHDEPVIGFAFDGTGFGTDQAVWGGEVLIADYKGFRRAAHLGYVMLAGGDTSVHRPYRMALSHLHSAGLDWDEDVPAVAACPAAERRVLAHQLETGFGCVPTSSMGRLFDAVASLAGVRHVVDYEAEAAMEFEGLARGGGVHDIAAGDECYRFALHPGSADELPATADAAPVVRAVVDDVRSGVAASTISARFHKAVTRLIVDLAELARTETGLTNVVLSGGVFQNALLLGASSHALEERGFTVLRPRLLPPNDGGIALGQILVGASG